MRVRLSLCRRRRGQKFKHYIHVLADIPELEELVAQGKVAETKAVKTGEPKLPASVGHKSLPCLLPFTAFFPQFSHSYQLLFQSFVKQTLWSSCNVIAKVTDRTCGQRSSNRGFLWRTYSTSQKFGKHLSVFPLLLLFSTL